MTRFRPTVSIWPYAKGACANHPSDRYRIGARPRRSGGCRRGPWAASRVVACGVRARTVGMDVGKTAKSTFDFAWWVSPSALDAADYIVNAMKTNAQSSTVANIKKKLISLGNMGRNPLMLILPEFEEAQAMKDFADLVKPGGLWDYKLKMRPLYGEYSLDPKEGMLYRYDIWGNIHFGYIGRAIGFSEDLLLEAAGFVQALTDGKSYLSIAAAVGHLRDFDQPEDQSCIRIGFGLWERNSAGVTIDALLQAIRHSYGSNFKLATKEALEGKPPQSFLDKLE